MGDDVLHVTHQNDRIKIHFLIEMLDNDTRLNAFFHKRDCLHILLNCQIKFSKKEKFSVCCREYIKEATETDYVNYLLKLNYLIIDNEITKVKDFISSQNKIINQYKLAISREQDKLEVLEKYYPIYLL